jgi:hypothetical protein
MLQSIPIIHELPHIPVYVIYPPLIRAVRESPSRNNMEIRSTDWIAMWVRVAIAECVYTVTDSGTVVVTIRVNSVVWTTARLKPLLWSAKALRD